MFPHNPRGYTTLTVSMYAMMNMMISVGMMNQFDNDLWFANIHEIIIKFMLIESNF